MKQKAFHEVLEEKNPLKNSHFPKYEVIQLTSHKAAEKNPFL